MDVVAHAGDLGPVSSFGLDRELSSLTTAVRPRVIVDLTEATQVHPAVVSVLIRHQRQAHRQGGELRLVPPTDPGARHTLDQVGIVGLTAV